jgi:hypothetical protein
MDLNELHRTKKTSKQFQSWRMDYLEAEFLIFFINFVARSQA